MAIDEPEKSMQVFNLASGIASILGFVIAVVFWWLERRARLKTLADVRRRVWAELSKVKELLGDLEKDIADGEFGHRHGIFQAHGELTFMFRDLLKDAIKLEPDFSSKTIGQWRRTGKLSSNWQEKIAWHLALTEEVIDCPTNPAYAIWDELPTNHPVASLYGPNEKPSPVADSNEDVVALNQERVSRSSGGPKLA
jgi:hypothetical protein